MKKTLLILFLFINLLSFSQPIIFDIEGNSYKTVIIGEQEWMAENLKTTKFKDGRPIHNELDPMKWIHLTTPSYAWYNDDPDSFKETYGALYNYYAVETDSICPNGWRVPDITDIRKLVLFLDPVGSAVHTASSEIVGGMLKEAGNANWPPYENVQASNSSGFSAVPGGCRAYLGTYNAMFGFGYYWILGKKTMALRWATNRVFINDGGSKYVGISVRCIKVEMPPVL